MFNGIDKNSAILLDVVPLYKLMLFPQAMLPDHVHSCEVDIWWHSYYALLCNVFHDYYELVGLLTSLAETL